MEKDDYWWNFIQDMENFYILITNNYDISNNSLFYSFIKRINNFIYGYDDISLNGVVYGFKLIPEEQNKLWSSSLYIPGEEIKNKNYNIKCINIEYSSMPYGEPVTTNGTVVSSHYRTGTNQPFIELENPIIFDNGLLGSTSDLPISYNISPPKDLQEILLTSSVYMTYEIRNGKPSLQINNIFLKGLDENPIYLGEHRNTKLSIYNIDKKYYINNIYNSNIFPFVPNEAIDIARVIWRINTTIGEKNTHKYEYYIIDTRKPYGYYGWRQPDEIRLIASIERELQIETSLIDYLEELWSFIFYMPAWKEDGFIHYWETRGKIISETITELYNNLYIE